MIVIAIRNRYWWLLGFFFPLTQQWHDSRFFIAKCDTIPYDVTHVIFEKVLFWLPEASSQFDNHKVALDQSVQCQTLQHFLNNTVSSAQKYPAGRLCQVDLIDSVLFWPGLATLCLRDTCCTQFNLGARLVRACITLQCLIVSANIPRSSVVSHEAFK